MSDEEPAGVLDVLRRGTPRSAGIPSCYGPDDLSVPSFGEVAPFREQDIELFRYEPDGVAEEHQQLGRSGSAVDSPVEPPVEPFEAGAVAVGPGQGGRPTGPRGPRRPRPPGAPRRRWDRR